VRVPARRPEEAPRAKASRGTALPQEREKGEALANPRETTQDTITPRHHAARRKGDPEKGIAPQKEKKKLLQEKGRKTRDIAPKEKKTAGNRERGSEHLVPHLASGTKGEKGVSLQKKDKRSGGRSSCKRGGEG